MANTPFEIPQTIRDLAEQNINSAHAAYEQLTEFVTKALAALMDAMPSHPAAAALKKVQDRAMEIAKENAESAFALGEKISKAQDFREILTLQTQFAQERMRAFVTQTQKLYGLIGEALQKSERGPLGTGTAATPPDPITAGFNIPGFKDVQDRAVAMTKQNAESAFALPGKIMKAQNIQDIFSLESQFAQDQMQAYAAQTQALQQLIGDALKKLQRG